MFAEYLFTQVENEPIRVFPGMVTGELSIQLQSMLEQNLRQFEKDGTLLLEGDECQSVYCVLDGWMVLSKTLLEGQTQIIDFALPGDIIEPASADGVTSLVTLTGLTAGAVGGMPYNNWEQMIEAWPELHRVMHRIEAARRARRAERILRLGKGSAEMRVAYALLEFCVRLGACGNDGESEFHVPLTQQQLGDYIGLSSVHVCRTMRRMGRNGIVAMGDHMDIRILDARSLAQLAGVDRDVLEREIMPCAGPSTD